MTDQNQPAPQPQLELPAAAAAAGTMLTLRVVADRLGCSLATVRRMVSKGELEGAQQQHLASGPQWLVPLATVETLQAQRRQAAAAAPVTVRASAAAQQLEAELVATRQRLAETLARAQVAEALADERALQLAQAHENVRLLIAQLPPAAAPAPAVPQRHWWRRSKGK